MRNSMGMDVKLFGGLFMIVGTVDMVIIDLFPLYALKLFGAEIGGTRRHLFTDQPPMTTTGPSLPERSH